MISANIIIDLVNNALKNGGDTLFVGREHQYGYIVGDGKMGLKFPVNSIDKLCVTDLADSMSVLVKLIHITRYWKALGYDTVGTWVHEGTLYLDPGTFFDWDSEHLAIACGKARNEIAIWDNLDNVEIVIDGSDNSARDV